MVAGNHEFYSCKSRQITYDQVIHQIEKVSKGLKNVHFLNRSFVDINLSNEEVIRFAGCTLWTLISKYPQSCERYVNDYNLIMVKTEDPLYI